jgi:predicted Zn-dependent protease
MLAITTLVACLNGTILEQDEVVKRLHLAENAIEARDWERAKKVLALRDEHILDDRLLRRRALLMAVVNLRLGNTRPAARAFRAFLRSRKDDPVLRARLAEAEMDHGGYQEIEARHILLDLERRDLMPDGEAWAALARLRNSAGEDVDRDRAVARCRAVAPDPRTCPDFSVASR